jgi:hypothetical protein
MTTKAKKRRTRRTPTERAVLHTMKEVRRKRLAFEKEISALLSEAVNAECSFKLKKPTKGSPAERRVRKAGKVKSVPYYESLDELSKSPNAPTENDALWEHVTKANADWSKKRLRREFLGG